VGCEGFVSGDGSGRRRGQRFGYTGGDVFVPVSSGLVAEEVELGGVVCPGKRNMEIYATLLVGKVLVSLMGI
jgi:hypothetical protein